MSLSLEDLWGGFLGIEHLISCTDYAMWLAMEYDGHDEKTPIRLHSDFNQERDKHLNEFLADHRDELDSGECPNCGREQRGIVAEKCPNCGIKRDEERYVREWAWRRLRFSVPGLQARCIVPAYLCDDLCGSYTANPSGGVDVPLAVARASLLRHVTKLRKNYVRKCWDHLCISSSQDLISNDSSPEAHQRYLANRQKLVNGYNWLTGIANQYPEFMEDYEAHTGIRTFPPPIEMRVAPVVECQSAQAVSAPPTPDQPTGNAGSTTQAEPGGGEGNAGADADKEIRDLESNTPPLDRNSGKWINNKRAAELEGVETRTLADYRSQGIKNADKTVGRDRAGRVWRREGTPNSHPWYLRSTLHTK